MSLDFYQNINNFIIYIRNNRKDENIYNIISNHLDDLMRTHTKEQNILHQPKRKMRQDYYKKMIKINSLILLDV
jgi:hypothetical protein